ncbi:FixH family protein [Pseudomonas sp. S9]|uniref:FixH family protein n=1 Tax=Pseudomonas sp. S9 TaxID=686578 RepID=UPI0002556B93|nr:FixH family protein [Pseudomonas sp. S9]
MTEETTVAPWYKQFWPWFIIGLLSLSVVQGGSMLIFSINNPPGLISDNYYEVGKGINQSLDRENLAKQLKVSANITFNNETGVVDMQLKGLTGPAVLKLNVISPTQPERDRHITMQARGDGNYTGNLEDAVQGRRFVELIGREGGKDWRVFEEEVLESGKTIRLGDDK